MIATKQRRGRFRYRNTEGTQGRSPCDIKDRDWSDAVYKETSRIIRGHQKLGGGKEEFYPNLQSDCDLADTLIQISGQNCERIISIVLSHPVCDTRLWQP